jgi:hypothetical protein
MPYFFVHMQKTAGTAMFRRLRHHFGDAAVYPDDSDGPRPDCVLDVDHLRRRWAARHADIAVVTGHFPLCTTELLGDDFTTFTLLREPVERTLSNLRHRQQTDPAAAGQSLEQIYDDPIRFDGLVHNHMVKMLSLTVDEMTDGAMTKVDFTDERFVRAKANLATVDVVGVQEQFDDFCNELERRFGWDLGPPVRMNRTKPVPVADELLARIRRDNAMDIALYDDAYKTIGR